jgi:hypothetical protein
MFGRFDGAGTAVVREHEFELQRVVAEKARKWPKNAHVSPELNPGLFVRKLLFGICLCFFLLCIFCGLAIEAIIPQLAIRQSVAVFLRSPETPAAAQKNPGTLGINAGSVWS